MDAPAKPWERPGVSSQSAPNTFTNGMSSFTEYGVSAATPTVPQPANQRPPPVPQRPSTQGLTSYYGGIGNGMGYSNMSNTYGSNLFGSGVHNGYGGYGGYSSYGNYGMNNFGQGGYGQTGFACLAEENSRQAFQSIESIVQAFGSVAMMLESTYSAVFNSFRAVIGVADHFSRLKTHLAQVFSALALIRTLKWLYRKVLTLLHLRPGGMDEEAWAEASEAGEQLIKIGGKATAKASWPIMLFFAVIIGGPWLIWKFLCSISKAAGDPKWANGHEDHFVAIAEYDFDGEADDELSFKRGNRINIAPKELQPRIRGWLLGSVDGKKTGILPANYIKILGKRKGLRHMANQVETTSTGAGQPANVLHCPDQGNHVLASEPYSLNPDDVKYCDTKEIYSEFHRHSPTPQLTDKDAAEILDSTYKDISNQSSHSLPNSALGINDNSTHAK